MVLLRYHNTIPMTPTTFPRVFLQLCSNFSEWLDQFCDLKASKVQYGNYSMQINRKIRSDKQRETQVSSHKEYHTANKDKSRVNLLRVNDATTETTPNSKSFATSVPLVYSIQHNIPNNMINLKKGGIILTSLYRFVSDRPVPYPSHNL